MAQTGKTFVVEHLDPELEAWSSLEYRTIAAESHATGAKFLLSSVPTSLKLPENLQGAQGLNVETRGIEEIYADKKDRVCLLDPAAAKDLSPEDGNTFDIFLFGGILAFDIVPGLTSIQEMTPHEISFIDHPELKINKNESTEMPFRYVKGEDGRPIMPEARKQHLLFQLGPRFTDIIRQGMVDLIIKDSEKSLDDLL
ncbi:hypothetical protein SNOG_05142 [Parastagonospora nodorum SN15]|uniref:Uncharacterized protein n=1 Tax=Phaeosphaeria nodorum (strain SN15 / ATCC MYA-4574 / FGSC 10173) TaxID=321614 RepID=Q0USX2_PHANO|nr:hypothetical protein SNOG_05142 [Parastagonospora nodorum SN15]EAT87533.2 hypothetical protein SNOG_05142 [Parastagonospora nodorum SN15]